MERYLHTLSGVAFYILGSTFFLAYVLLRNDVAAGSAATWLRIGDMPLLLTGLLYGGLSIHRSLQNEAGNTSRLLILAIAFPAFLLFAAFAVMNFS